MKKVYVVFEVSGDGDGYSQFDLRMIADTLEIAKVHASKITKDLVDNETFRKEHREETKGYMDLVHKSMTKENDYTYIGQRKEVSIYCEYNYFGGIIIEEMELITQ
jgi:hypothetical protein